MPTALHPRPGHAPVIEVEVERTGEEHGWITRKTTGRIRATCPCNAAALGQWAYSDDVMLDLQTTCIDPA